MLPCHAQGILYTHSCGQGTARFQEDRNVQTKVFLLLVLTLIEGRKLEDAQGGRKVELGTWTPSWCPWGLLF